MACYDAKVPKASDRRRAKSNSTRYSRCPCLTAPSLKTAMHVELAPRRCEAVLGSGRWRGAEGVAGEVEPGHSARAVHVESIVDCREGDFISPSRPHRPSRQCPRREGAGTGMITPGDESKHHSDTRRGNSIVMRITRRCHVNSIVASNPSHLMATSSSGIASCYHSE